MKRRKTDATASKKLLKKRDRDQEQEVSMEPEFIEALKKYKILQGSKLDSEQVVKFVKYRKNESEGVWEEEEAFPEELFVALGFDSQQQKAD